MGLRQKTALHKQNSEEKNVKPQTKPNPKPKKPKTKTKAKKKPPPQKKKNQPKKTNTHTHKKLPVKENSATFFEHKE